MPNIHSREIAGSPLYNHYRCSDGKWICLAMMQSEHYWGDFCRVLGIKELENDPRFNTVDARRENSGQLLPIIERIFASKPRGDWLKVLEEGGDFVYAAVNTMDDVMTDQQVLQNQYIADFDHPAMGKIKVLGSPITFSRTPAGPRLPAPEFGQHTEEVLLGLGYSWEDIVALRDDGAI